MDVKLNKTEQINEKKQLQSGDVQKNNESLVVLDEKDFEPVQKKNQVTKSFAEAPYSSELDLFGKDFYRNPYLLKERMNKDTVKLGSKTWKPNDAQKEKNKRIDAAKAISKNATGYTLVLHDKIVKVNKVTDLREQYRTEHNDAYEYYFGRLSNVHFTAKMFGSAYIVKHFEDCYTIVRNFRQMKEIAQADGAHSQDAKDFLENAEIFELFTKRIAEFAKKNHVNINTGEGVNEKLRANETITNEDYDRWLVLTGEAKIQRNEERLNEALENCKDIELSKEQLDKLNEPFPEVNYEDVVDFDEYLTKTATERILAIPEIEANIRSIQKQIGPKAPKLAKIELRRELSEMKALLRFVKAELAIYNARQNGAVDTESLKKDYPAQVKELHAASENIRKLQKRQGDIVIERTVPKGIVKLSREESMSTYSDNLSMKKRMEILRLSGELLKKFPKNNDINPDENLAVELNKLVTKYFEKNFYKVGYRQEAKALKKIFSYIRDNKLKEKPQFADLINTIETMANGSLVVPQGAEIIDKTVGFTRPVSATTQDMDNPSFAKVNSLLDTFTKWEDRSNEPLFPHEPTVNDLRQGKVSNCWMVASTTALINTNPQIIKDALKDNGDGTVTVRLFTYEEDKTDNKHHVVPKYIRVKKETPKLIAGGAVHTSGALWMQMLEKAAAFIGYRGPSTQNPALGYNALWHGSQGKWLFALTGLFDDQIASGNRLMENMEFYNDTVTKGIEGFTTLKGRFQDAIKDESFLSELFNDMLHAREKGIIYTYGTKTSDAEGMNTGHAYTVLGAKEVGGERYVILRNPYGNMNSMYDEKGKLVRTESYFNSSMNETYGQFLIKFEDFFKNGAIISRFDASKYGHHKEEAEKMQEYKEQIKASVKDQDTGEKDDF